MAVLADKTAVVTGAASGIGRAIAELFATEGAAVVLADRDDGSAVVDAIVARGGAASFVRTDVADATQVQQLMTGAESRHGRLDVLVAAAGVSGGSAPTIDYQEEDFDRVIAIDLKGVFLAMKYALPALLRTGRGAIVNIASITALVALPRTPAYSAAKGGVVQLTKVAALEYAERGIRVNCICPGMIDTPMARGPGEQAMAQLAARHPLGRAGLPQEVAAAALFLASDQSSFVTGAALVVDGGFTAQ